jgi:hypothetical protein
MLKSAIALIPVNKVNNSAFQDELNGKLFATDERACLVD